MITIKEYAAQKRVSYEAVRRQLKRYEDELKPHISVVGRTQYIDEEGIEFLDQKRRTNPVVIFEHGREEEIQRLSEENKTLLLRLNELQAEMIESQKAINSLNQDKIALLEEIRHVPDELQKARDQIAENEKTHEEEMQRMKAELDQKQTEVDQKQNELDQMQEELAQERSKTFLQRLFGR